MITAVRASAPLPQTATENLFVVSGGPVIIHGVWGVVAEATESAPCSLSVSNSVIYSVQVGARAVGILISDATGVSVVAYPTAPRMLAEGATLAATTDASLTGQVVWYVRYDQVTPNSVVVPQ